MCKICSQKIESLGVGVAVTKMVLPSPHPTTSVGWQGGTAGLLRVTFLSLLNYD